MNTRTFFEMLNNNQPEKSSSIRLDHGSRVAVIGGGPAGSFFSYFLLEMAERVGLKIHVDIYESRDFNVAGPAGCNMCGGVIYESLIQSLAMDGISLPTNIVERGIEYNKLHMDIGNVQIQTPRREKRIATTYRGAGPRGVSELKIGSLDGYLMQAAISKGARHINCRVKAVERGPTTDTNNSNDRLIQIKTQNDNYQTYELLAVTSGVNTAILNQFQDLDIGYKPPQTTKLLVREYFMGEEKVSKYLGPVFHAFLLKIPGLDYGAIIPKGEYMSVCLLSSHGDLDPALMETFLNDPAVRRALPPDFSPSDHDCHCRPRINVKASAKSFGNRIVFIGDSGVSRLYKDGIGATYRAAKIAASTAIFQGISANDFKNHYLPFCRKMDFDNKIGKLLFKSVSQVQKMRIARQAVLRMVSYEQQGKTKVERGMSMVMWDMLTGGALYGEVLKRILHPEFLARFLWNIFFSLFSSVEFTRDIDLTGSPLLDQSIKKHELETNAMNIGALGKIYQDGEVIVRQGEVGDCMFVVQDGFVEVLIESGNQEIHLNVLGKDEFFGEMAIFEHEIRSATVRAKGPARILTVDHKNFLHRIHEDPSLAYRLIEVMSGRVNNLNEEVTKLKLNLSEKTKQ